MTARRCDACRTMIPEGTPALVPALKGTGVRTWVWTCPACGCQNYDAPPEEEKPAMNDKLLGDLLTALGRERMPAAAVTAMQVAARMLAVRPDLARGWAAAISAAGRRTQGPGAARHPFGPPSVGDPQVCVATVARPADPHDACGLHIDHHVHRVEQLTPVQAALLQHVATTGSTAHEEWHVTRPGPTLLDLHRLMSLALLVTVDDVATVTNRGRSWLEARYATDEELTQR